MRQISKPVEAVTDELRALIADMFETMYEAPGIGLAAIQVGQPLRLLVIDLQEEEDEEGKPIRNPRVFINPELTEPSAEMSVYNEGCLSVPNLRGMVQRYVHLRCQAWDRHGNAIDEVVHGLKAGTYQHEVDHLLGKIFVDRVTDPRTFSTWTEFDRHHKAAFVERATALVARVGS